MKRYFWLFGARDPSGPWCIVLRTELEPDMEELMPTGYQYHKIEEIWEWPF